MSVQETTLAVEDRGRERYAATWARQLELHARRAAGEAGDTLLLVEHEHVVTLGRHGASSNLVAGEAQLAARGIDLHSIERGGDITYHGPGQLVGYPIVSLRERGLSVHAYVTALESALIAACAQFGVAAKRVAGLNGVWVRDGGAGAPPAFTGEGARATATEDKLAAIGVAVRRGVSYHGFALNVATDLSMFQLIVPCGITGRGVASLSALLGREVSLDEVKPLVVVELERALESAL